MPDKLPEFSDWFIKFAPKDWKDIFGQDVIVDFYEKCKNKEEWPKTTFLQSTFGQGKTAIAKLIASDIACKVKDCDKTCPTCAAIFNETFDRDVIYLNGTSMSAAEVDSILDTAFLTSAFRDRAKVFIIDETQGLSPQAVNKFLIATQSPKKGVYFIFTAMDKLSGKNPGALYSRCKVWKLRIPKCEEIYNYLASICMKRKLNDCPKEFLGDGLKFIAENSEYSFRKALQMLEQCYEGKIFDVKVIKETFSIVSYDDASQILVDLSHGNISEAVFNTITGMDYQDKFPLLYKIIGDAAVYRVFHNQFVDESDKWKWKYPASISTGKYFSELCETFKEISQSAYIQRGKWQIELSNFLYKIKGIPNIEVTEVEKKVQRKKI